MHSDPFAKKINIDHLQTERNGGNYLSEYLHSSNRKVWISHCEKVQPKITRPDNNSFKFFLELDMSTRPPPPLERSTFSTLLLETWRSFCTGYPDVPTRHRERKCNSHAMVMRRKRAWAAAAHILRVTFYIGGGLFAAETPASFPRGGSSHLNLDSLDVGKELMWTTLLVFMPHSEI